MNYFIVLFKNNKKQRIIKKFVGIENAEKFYRNLLEKSENIIFDTKIKNGKEVKFEIAILEKTNKNNTPIYLNDDFGRNIKIKLEDDNLVVKKISRFRIEEKIFDIQKNKKITVPTLIKNYLSTDTLKVMFVLNNKIVIQKDELINIFSVKNEEESIRFVESVQSFYFKNKKNDCLFITDTSIPQKKYLFDLLSRYGVDKKILYRKFTTHPQ